MKKIGKFALFVIVTAIAYLVWQNAWPKPFLIEITNKTPFEIFDVELYDTSETKLLMLKTLQSGRSAQLFSDAICEGALYIKFANANHETFFSNIDEYIIPTKNQSVYIELQPRDFQWARFKFIPGATVRYSDRFDNPNFKNKY